MSVATSATQVVVASDEAVYKVIRTEAVAMLRLRGCQRKHGVLIDLKHLLNSFIMAPEYNTSSQYKRESASE